MDRVLVAAWVAGWAVDLEAVKEAGLVEDSAVGLAVGLAGDPDEGSVVAEAAGSAVEIAE